MIMHDGAAFLSAQKPWISKLFDNLFFPCCGSHNYRLDKGVGNWGDATQV